MGVRCWPWGRAWAAVLCLGIFAGVPTESQSRDLIVPLADGKAPDPGTPPDAELISRLQAIRPAVSREWYESRGLIPRSQTTSTLKRTASEDDWRYSYPNFAPGGDRVAPNVRGSSNHENHMTATGSYQIDLSEAATVIPRGITIRNTGTANVSNPWVVVNGVGNWYSVANIVQSALGTERDAEAASLKIWEFLRGNRYHWTPITADNEMHSPVKFLNVWGYGFCDDSATNMECLLKAAGFPQARVWGIEGHVVAEAYYNDAWHMFDPDMEVFAPLKPSNTGQASVAQIAADPELMERVGIGFVAPYYSSLEDNLSYQNYWDGNYTMSMRLRPGESLSRRFGNWGKYAAEFFPNEPEPPYYGNGEQRLEANYAYPERRNSLSKNVNGTWSHLAPYYRPSNPSQSAILGVNITSAYAVVGGYVATEVHLNDGETLVVRARRPDTSTLTTVLTQAGPFTGGLKVSVDSVIGRIGKYPRYGYTAEFEIVPAPAGSAPSTAPTGISEVVIHADLQLAPAALPRLLAGRVNDVSVSLSPAPGGSLSVDFDWDSMTTTEALAAIPSRARISRNSLFPDVQAVLPADGAVINTLSPVLSWTGGVLADEEVGWRSLRMTYDAEGKYPVSPVLMPRGTMESQFEIPGGWLQPGKNYYWQVREGSNREPRSRMFQFSTSAQISGASSVADWNRY